MSQAVIPQFTHERLSDDGVRARAKFIHSDLDEILFVDAFSDVIGINWTTQLNAYEIPKIIHQVLPETAEVEVWYHDEARVFSSDESGRILDSIKARDPIRMTYIIEPNEMACNGLVVAWRIPVESESPFYRLGVLVETQDSLDLPKSLIEISASRHVKSTPNLLDTLIEHVHQFRGIEVDVSIEKNWSEL